MCLSVFGPNPSNHCIVWYDDARRRPPPSPLERVVAIAGHPPTAAAAVVPPQGDSRTNASFCDTSTCVITGRNEYTSHSFGCMDLV